MSLVCPFGYLRVVNFYFCKLKAMDILNRRREETFKLLMQFSLVCPPVSEAANIKEEKLNWKLYGMVAVGGVGGQINV